MSATMKFSQYVIVTLATDINAGIHRRDRAIIIHRSRPIVAVLAKRLRNKELPCDNQRRDACDEENA